MFFKRVNEKSQLRGITNGAKVYNADWVEPENPGWITPSTKAYTSLRNYAFWVGGMALFISEMGIVRGGPSYDAANYGTREASLMNYLKPSHHNANLTDQERYRIIVWLDNLSPFHGTFDQLERQARGELLWPLIGRIVTKLKEMNVSDNTVIIFVADNGRW